MSFTLSKSEYSVLDNFLKMINECHNSGLSDQILRSLMCDLIIRSWITRRVGRWAHDDEDGKCEVLVIHKLMMYECTH